MTTAAAVLGSRSDSYTPAGHEDCGTTTPTGLHICVLRCLISRLSDCSCWGSRPELCGAVAL